MADTVTAIFLRANSRGNEAAAGPRRSQAGRTASAHFKRQREVFVVQVGKPEKEAVQASAAPLKEIHVLCFHNAVIIVRLYYSERSVPLPFDHKRMAISPRRTGR